MLIFAAIALGVLTAVVTGANLSKLGQATFRLPWLPIAALIGQALVLAVLDLANGVSAALHVVTYVVLLPFLVANRDHHGLWLLIAGFVLNSAAISVNGGVMPASQDALERAGRTEEARFRNSDVVEDARLAWLGDVFAVPRGLPLANVFSIGDVLVVLGVTVFVHEQGESRLARSRRSSRPRPTTAD